MIGLKKELGLVGLKDGRIKKVIGLKDGRISENGIYFGNRIYNNTVKLGLKDDRIKKKR